MLPLATNDPTHRSDGYPIPAALRIRPRQTAAAQLNFGQLIKGRRSYWILSERCTTVVTDHGVSTLDVPSWEDRNLLGVIELTAITLPLIELTLEGLCEVGSASQHKFQTTVGSVGETPSFNPWMRFTPSDSLRETGHRT